VAEILKESLSKCGIDLLIESLPDQLRYTEGEENRISGRRFDLALSSTVTNHIPACNQFVTWQISGPEEEQNPLSGQPYAGWEGINHSGWSNPDYDAACRSALNTIPGTADHALYHQQAQAIFAENLPILPLFFAPRTTATAATIPYINNNASQESELWNIFALDMVQ
jgi:peptide/nickel transport system substrate-binding protein